MTGFPRVVIDPAKVEDNTSTIVGMAEQSGMDIMAVTKAACGDPEVARAMIRGGAETIADSRVENIRRLKEAGIGVEITLLRSPMLSEVEDVVRYADMSINTELTVIEEISREARERGVVHPIMLLIEMGELREGATRTELVHLVEGIEHLEGVELRGVGTNLACFSGVVPTMKKMDEFDRIVDSLTKRTGMTPKVISGGNSGNIPLLMEDPGILKDHHVNNLRIGEGILLGLETIERTQIPDTHRDAFLLEAELIEVKTKPSVPEGEISQNAFGETPEFEDRGEISRGLLALGKQDVQESEILPLDDEVEILGSTSDHTVLHLRGEGRTVGDRVRFRLNYGGVVHAFTSQYVEKHYV